MKRKYELMSECPWCKLSKVKNLSAGMRYESVSEKITTGSWQGYTNLGDFHILHRYKVTSDAGLVRRCVEGVAVRQEEADDYWSLIRYAESLTE